MEDNKTIDKNQQTIAIGDIMKLLWSKRRVFFIMWSIVFVVSCVIILPQPRYYSCEVVLAPESADASSGGIAGIAADFGFNLNVGSTQDAIYPTLYPDLFESPEFLVDILNIKIETDDGKYKEDYYTYLKEHQQKNPITKPFNAMLAGIQKLFASDQNGKKRNADGKLNPFYLSKKDFSIVENVKNKVTCSVDKKTDVITVNVKDQDRLVCALLADSVRQRLQDFIIKYRTKKVRQDEKYYKHLRDSSFVVYETALHKYSAYQDGHRNAALQEFIGQGDKIKNDLDTKLAAYNTFNQQYEAMKAKVQERTPSFTTLKSATVPQRPAGPKRMMFVFGMLVLSTLIAVCTIARKLIFAI